MRLYWHLNHLQLCAVLGQDGTGCHELPHPSTIETPCGWDGVK